MTKKEETMFDNFKKECEKGEKTILTGAGFVAMDMQSFENRITKETAKKTLTETLENIFEVFDISEKNFLKKNILQRFSDILSKK